MTSRSDFSFEKPRAARLREVSNLLISPQGRLALVLSALAAVTPLCLRAADSSTPPPVASDHLLDEIVVTAQKRASTVQDTPISITALSGEQLKDRGIDTIEQIVQQVPGLSMRSAGPGMTEIEMRGLSATGGAAPTTGFYLDDAPLTPPLTSFSGKTIVSPEMYDLSRVEVLRGPQGTLYGSGAMGGVLRLITNQPDLTRTTGSAELDASGTDGGDTPNGAGNLAINLPIVTDLAAVRVVLTDKWLSGWIDRIVENPFPYPTNNGCAPTAFYGCARGDVLAGNVIARYHDVNWEHTDSARAELLVQPTEALKILTTILFQASFQGGPNEFDVPPGPGGTEAHYQPANIAEPYYDKFTVVTNTITGDLGFAQLTAATSYYNRNQTIISDIAEGYQSLFFLPNFLTEQDQAFILRNPAHQVSEELRLSSDHGPLKWIGGLFASREESAYFSYDGVKGMCYLSTGGCAANPLGITFFANNPYTLDQYAAFGELSYTLSDFTATVGGRYFRYNSNWRFEQSGIFGAYGNERETTGEIKGSNTGFTPKFNLSYEPNKNLTVYGTAAQGFRTGGINLPIPLTGAASCTPYLEALGFNGEPYQYKPDKVWSYELGEKGQLFGGRLTVNGDYYYNVWKDVQQQLNLGCAFSLQINAGTAVSYGPELEFSLRITPEITLDANGAYTKSYVSKPLVSSGIPEGTPLLNVPKYTENTALSYQRGFDDNKSWSFRVTNTLVGPTHDLAWANYELPMYDIVSARFQIFSGPYTYGVYGNNLGNTRAQLTSNNTVMDFNIPSVTRVSTNQPRTFGIDIRYRF